MAEMQKVAEGTVVPSTSTDWVRVAQLRRETEQAITRAEEAAKRLDEALNRRQSK